MKKILVLISLFMGCAICAQNRIPHVTESRYENKSIKEMGVWLGAEISGGVSVKHFAKPAHDPLSFFLSVRSHI